MALFESYERRIDKINGVLAQYGIGSVEECRELCKAKGFDPYEIVKGIQPICFENACWAYTVGAAIALKSGVKTAADAARKIGEGLQSFCIDGSVAEDRKVGIGHGNLGAMLLSDESKCFAFLAGHESFAAAEGAIGIVRNANKARKEPLRVILNGLGKDAAQIISRINGFTYVQTQFDYFTGKLNIVREIRYSETERADVRCYGADDVREGVAIMHHEGVDVSITGNSTNPTRFQHPVAGTYKKECIEQGKKYFSVASGGGTGRRSRFLRHDRHHGPYAQRRAVCRLQLRPCACGDDGLPGHGQQSYGRRDRGRGCCGGRGCEVIPIYTQTSPDRLSGDVFMCVYASALAEKAAQQLQQGSAVEIAEHSCCTSLWYLPCKTG